MQVIEVEKTGSAVRVFVGTSEFSEQAETEAVDLARDALTDSDDFDYPEVVAWIEGMTYEVIFI